MMRRCFSSSSSPHTLCRPEFILKLVQMFLSRLKNTLSLQVLFQTFFNISLKHSCLCKIRSSPQFNVLDRISSFDSEEQIRNQTPSFDLVKVNFAEHV